MHLVQERTGPDQFAYIAVARPKPKAAAVSLSALLPDRAFSTVPGDRFPGDRMHLVKRLGQRPSARDFDRQLAEFQVRVAVPTGFTKLGIPVTDAVGQVCPEKGGIRSTTYTCLPCRPEREAFPAGNRRRPEARAVEDWTRRLSG